MIIQRIWASLIGVVSSVIGTLALLSFVDIPMRDAVIHLITGFLFLTGAWIKAGKFVRLFNFILGLFFVSDLGSPDPIGPISLPAFHPA